MYGDRSDDQYFNGELYLENSCFIYEFYSFSKRKKGDISLIFLNSLLFPGISTMTLFFVYFKMNYLQ